MADKWSISILFCVPFTAPSIDNIFIQFRHYINILRLTRLYQQKLFFICRRRNMANPSHFLRLMQHAWKERLLAHCYLTWKMINFSSPGLFVQTKYAKRRSIFQKTVIILKINIFVLYTSYVVLFYSYYRKYRCLSPVIGSNNNSLLRVKFLFLLEYLLIVM